MNIQQAQNYLYELSEEFGALLDEAKILDKRAAKVNGERRKILQNFPVLDISRIGDKPKKVWTQEEITRWGDNQ